MANSMNSPRSRSGLVSTSDPARQQDDVVIAVMGSTGTGKSSVRPIFRKAPEADFHELQFIKLLTGATSITIGNSLESETKNVQVIRFLDRTSGRNMTVVDTPGFDDSRKGFTDTDVLKKVTDFLLDEYDKNRKLNGLIYLQRISDPRFGGQSSRNLRMFRGLCGANAFENVVILTTFWDQVASKQEGVRREEQLKSRFFKELVEGGACFMRYDRTGEGARKVIRHIFTLVPKNVKIQREIRIEGKSLEDTEAGSIHREEVERIIAKHKKELADLRAEMGKVKASSVELRRELEKETARYREHLTRWESEKSDLKKGLDDVRRTRTRLETEARMQKMNQETQRPHQEQEHEWSSRFVARAGQHDSALQELQEEQSEEADDYDNVISGYLSSTSNEFEFMYSDRYPPYLKSIPRRLRTSPLGIFDFLSLLETVVLLAVPTSILPPKALNQAPNSATVRTMQDLVDGNYQLHTQSQINQTRDMFFRRNIGHRDDWYTDAAFGQQQLTGTNPTTITLSSRRWIDEFMDAACTQQRSDVAQLLIDDPDSMYVQDYSDFRSAMGISESAELASEARYGCSSVALFHLEPEGQLHPIAITLDYKGSMEESVTIFNRRIASMTPGDESTDWPWRYAKMCSQVSDWLRHEVTAHLVNTHLVEEVIIVAAHRAFEPQHIVFKLLEPHWNITLPLNEAAREILVPKIIIGMTGHNAERTYAFIKDAYSRFDWTASYIPNDLRRRGFPIENLDEPKYHNCGYARNVARMWEILRNFVSLVLTEAYGSNTAVVNDTSISVLCQEVRSANRGQLASFPNIKKLDELIDFVTMCIHIASPQHTAVNYLQQYYQTFVPNKPSALYTPIPRSLEELEIFEEEDVLSALPVCHPRDWLVMAQVPYLLSFEVPDEGSILYYAHTTPDSDSTPEIIRNAATVLRDDLVEFTYTVSEYSEEIDDQHLTPYFVLDPSKTAISILL